MAAARALVECAGDGHPGALRLEYALNVDTTFTKASGAFTTATLGATLARTVVRDSSQFIPRTIAQIVDSMKATGASVMLVEAYP